MIRFTNIVPDAKLKEAATPEIKPAPSPAVAGTAKPVKAPRKLKKPTA